MTMVVDPYKWPPKIMTINFKYTLNRNICEYPLSGGWPELK